MPETILVVEYEPRYADRARQALVGQSITASFARDGEEAARALDAGIPRLVVLSSVIPKGSTAELIRTIRGRSDSTPILLTVSGYNGTTPAQDAMRLGASDILPKPYSETDFLNKVQQLLAAGTPAAPGHLTSDDIFGDIVDDKPSATAPKKGMSSKDDIDRLLEDTLSGVRRTRGTTAPGTAARPQSDFDKLVKDTLSGLEKKKTTSGGTTAVPRPQAPDVATPRAAAPPPMPAPDEPPAPPVKEEEEPTDGVRFGQYVLLEKIAAGGMAEVWKARKRGEEGFQKIVAIKKILPHLSDNQDFIEMFIDEAKLAAQLNHNNIIHIYDLGKIQSSYFIAMEYVDGHDLKSILKRGQERGQPLGPELSLFVASKIAAALDYAHRRRDFDQQEMGLVHRDVSPQNILISQDGDIKLCDFGIAKAASKASHTQAGALKGKLQYMAPEQAWGRNVDRRSDIFALGTVLFEMLTGRKLFTGDNEMSILEQVREARVTPPSSLEDEVTPEIDAIVAKALQKEPADRYQTAGEMAKDIDSVLYSLRPTPTSADLAIYMHRVWGPEAAQPLLHDQPTVIDAPLPVPPRAAAAPATGAAVAAAATAAAVPAASPGVAMPAWDAATTGAAAAPAAAPRRKRSGAGAMIFVAVLLAAVIGGFLYIRSLPTPSLSRPETTELRSTPSVATQPVATTTPAETGTLVPIPTETTNTIPPAVGSDTVAPPLDPALVDLEVQRLIAAERARLEAQALAAQRQRTATVAPPPATTQPPARAVPPPAAVREPAPQPQPQPTTPAPATPPTETVAPAPAPTTPPAQQAAAARRFSEGDLVPQGTEGLTPARVIRYGSVPYPPMARSQRVQGTVIMSVLISEKGEVLETRVLRGVPRPVGLNEAAEQVIRRSTFSTPMLTDGTRVKAWSTVPVKFEL